jgi:hypothetical protein
MPAIRIRLRTAWVAAVVLAVWFAAPAGQAETRSTLRFGPPVLVSPDVAWTWEPTLLIDRFGNVLIAARKNLEQLVLAPDPRSPTLTRSMSWLWISTDGGKTFDNMHGYPLDLENHSWGYESDIALDDAGHLYQVDQTYLDSTIARWTITGRGTYRFDYFRPFIPTAQPIDDRPWLAAHGSKSLIYLSQAGAPFLNPFGRGGGEAYGPGRYSVHHSGDGGSSFDLIGHSLNNSGACRPAADHRRGSRLLYIVCTNDAGKLWAFVSDDDGTSYQRFRVGSYNRRGETFDWPLVTVGPNGDVWALHVDADEVRGSEIITNRLNLYHSSDRGRTWSLQDITRREGRYRWGGLAVSSKGRLGLAIQHRPNADTPWRVYAASFRPGSIPTLVSVDEAHPVYGAENPEPPSEICGVAFAGDGSLAVAWTRMEAFGPYEVPRVYFARSVQR